MGEALIREADNLACQSWNEKMWSDGGPIDPSPTIDQAVNGAFGMWICFQLRGFYPKGGGGQRFVHLMRPHWPAGCVSRPPLPSVARWKAVADLNPAAAFSCPAGGLAARPYWLPMPGPPVALASVLAFSSALACPSQAMRAGAVALRSFRVEATRFGASGTSGAS